ncbi:hypothetical protein GGR53DRAFT_134793 [Hypoxylon sp. FL1150]|nr:hypothetical protein GGR53DRAFT_134793 [Hypoxylon sp. FL1150]
MMRDRHASYFFIFSSFGCHPLSGVLQICRGQSNTRWVMAGLLYIIGCLQNEKEIWGGDRGGVTSTGCSDLLRRATAWQARRHDTYITIPLGLLLCYPQAETRSRYVTCNMYYLHTGCHHDVALPDNTLISSEMSRNQPNTTSQKRCYNQSEGTERTSKRPDTNIRSQPREAPKIHILLYIKSVNLVRRTELP